jgi:hypothetical protein
MSRIADAHARAGVRLPGDEEQRWNTERVAAERYLEIPKFKSQNPNPKAQEPTSNFQLPTPKPELGGWKLAVAVSLKLVRSSCFSNLSTERQTDPAAE